MSPILTHIKTLVLETIKRGIKSKFAQLLVVDVYAMSIHPQTVSISRLKTIKLFFSNPSPKTVFRIEKMFDEC